MDIGSWCETLVPFIEEVATTATTVVPAGVLGEETAGASALPPPPHETTIAITAIASITSIKRRLPPAAPKVINANTPKLANAKSGRVCDFGVCGFSAAAVPAVLITNVEVAGEVPGVTDEGVRVHVASAGTLLHDRATAELKPPTEETEMVIDA